MNMNDYLKNEEKCGYLVTSEEKKVRMVQMDIVREIDKVCRRNKITYYIDGGTLLGAIRHQGYIPWDDDIDLAMFREDYNRFCEIAPKEFSEPYFFQSVETDPGFFSKSVYICNSNTTCVEDNPNNSWIKFNRGIKIGIQCLDSCSITSITKLDIIRKWLTIQSKMCNIVCGINRKKWTSFIRVVLKALRFNPKRIWCRTQKFLTKYDQKWKQSEYAIFFLGWENETKKQIRHKSDYEQVVQLPFEYMLVNCPSGYDRILKTQYGDYKKYPPEEERHPKHHETCDPETPYKDYCSSHFNVMY